jgi:hypothetical protein
MDGRKTRRLLDSSAVLKHVPLKSLVRCVNKKTMNEESKRQPQNRTAKSHGNIRRGNNSHRRTNLAPAARLKSSSNERSLSLHYLFIYFFFKSILLNHSVPSFQVSSICLAWLGLASLGLRCIVVLVIRSSSRDAGFARGWRSFTKPKKGSDRLGWAQMVIAASGKISTMENEFFSRPL